jgi:sulfite exporter TauE/SafE
MTGLTTGGLSCLAVQGGMLASSIAGGADAEGVGEGKDVAGKTGQAAPILLFLGAKLVAYTVLGALLGWLGSLLQLTPLMRAALQIGIGIFMMGTALRLLNAHPIFRYFVIAPPKWVNRYIRSKKRQASGEWLQPVFLGALTVLIPCGVTQAMMALAVASGNPWAGALIMLAFILGTSPVFFTLAYLAVKVGSRWQNVFWKFTGAVVLALGLLAIYGGLVLFGVPLTLPARPQTDALQTRATPIVSVSPEVSPAGSNIENKLEMRITDQAYTPAVMRAKSGLPINLVVSTKNVHGCASSLVIPTLNMQRLLGPTDMQSIFIPPQSAGSVVKLTCVMGMYNAQIDVE